MSNSTKTNSRKKAPTPTKSANTRKAATHKLKNGVKKPKAPAQSDRQEPNSQFTLKMRESLHQELARLAFDDGMTMRGFIMNALQSKGLSVTEADLRDRRRK